MTKAAAPKVSSIKTLAKEATGWDPSTVSLACKTKYDWTCPKGHVFKAAPVKRGIGQGCPFCSGRRALPGFNDLATTHPSIAAEAYGWDPATITPGSSRRLAWKGAQCGHVWEAVVFDRSARGHGCLVCSGHVVLPGFNDLATTHPSIAAEAYGWDPSVITSGSGRRLVWKGAQCDHTWEAVVCNRTGLDLGCPYCSGRKTLPGFNDLATTHPSIAAEAYGWDPATVLPGTHAKKKWLGVDCGHLWDAEVVTRTRVNSGCPYCSGHKTLPGFNDLATTHPSIAAEAHGWDPATISAGSHSKRVWRGSDCGHVWEAQVKNRTHGRGCPECASCGYRQSRRGYLYVVSRGGLLKVGISNVPQDRIATHARSGWTQEYLSPSLPGRVPPLIESETLHALEDMGVPVGPKAARDVFDGYTECWSAEAAEALGVVGPHDALRLSATARKQLFGRQARQIEVKV